MPPKLDLEIGSPAAPVKRVHLGQSRAATHLGDFFRGAALATLGLLATTGTASARPPQEVRTEQVGLSRLTDPELISHIALGVDAIESLIRAEADCRLVAERDLEPLGGLDGLTRHDLDPESPVQKLAEKQRARAERIALVDRLRPLVEELKSRQHFMASEFDDYIEIPPEPNVESADGEFRLISNLALFGQLKQIIGEEIVKYKLSFPEAQRLSAKTSYESRVRPSSGLTPYDLDEESPAQKLKREQIERPKKIELANKLKPLIAEATKRGLSWASKFGHYLKIPPEPNVDFADGESGLLSNKFLLDKVMEILGSEDRAYTMLAYRDGPWRHLSTLNITGEEASKLAPFLANAELRHLSWPSKIERFLPEKVAEQIIDLESKIRTQYGIRIRYGKSPSDTWQLASKPMDQQLIKYGLNNLLEFLIKYPPNVRNRFRNTTVYLAVDLKLKTKDKRAIAIGGSAGSSVIVVDLLNDDVKKTLDHEYFHILDKSDDPKKDNSTWALANPHGMRDYTFLTSAEAVEHGSEFEPPIPPPGFARIYGKEGGPDEDQATIADRLLNPVLAGSITKRAMEDAVLRKKVEMETGCLFDPATGRFQRALTKEEYTARLRFRNFQYYSTWSRLPTGELTMDSDFWNAIADGKPKKFE